MKRRLLISGFEAFGGEAMNPSSRLIEDLAWLTSVAPDLDIKGVLLPVTFGEAYEPLRALVRDFDPDFVVSLGQAGGRSDLSLERVAINCIDADIKDNSGAQPRDLPVVEGGATAYFSTLPLRLMLEAGNASGTPCSISNTAGTYVCNFLMYRLLEENRFSPRRCGFIHVPYLPEQAEKKTPPPSAMTLDQMKAGLSAMLKVLR